MTFVRVIIAGFLTSSVAWATTVNDFTVPSATDHRLLHLSDYAGKVVLINWWRTTCPWSQRETPKLVELNQRYAEKGLVILGISDDNGSSVGSVAGYLKSRGVTWPVGLNDQGEIMAEVVARGTGDTPANYLVEPDGTITFLGLDRSADAWKKLESAVAAATVKGRPAKPAIARRAPPTAPPLSLPDLQGKMFSSAAWAQKPTVVNFFTAQSCDWSGAVLARLSRDYGKRGLQVVGVDLFDNDSAVQGCVQKHGASYPVLKGDQATQQAWLGSNKGWATFFVTRDGRVLKKIDNSIEDGLESVVFPVYAEQLVSTVSSASR